MSVIEKDLNPDTYIGLALPLRHGNEGFFSKTKRTIDQLKFDIKNLLLTIKGERLGNPTFGSDLMRVIFEPNNDDIDSAIEESIRASISEWLPSVNIENIEITKPEFNPHLVNVRILFTVDVSAEPAEVKIAVNANS